MSVSITVSVEIDSLAPSTSRAKIQAIQDILDTNEGQLTFNDENGSTLSWLAQPVSDNIGQILDQGHGIMTIRFSATEESNSNNSTSAATFTTWENTTINIHRVHKWDESIKTTRKDERISARQLTTITITLQGRTTWVDTSLPYDQRLAWLHQQRNILTKLNTKEGTLTRGDFSETVQVENISIGIGGNAEYLTLSLQCRHTALPDGTQAEATFTVTDDTDWDEGKLTRKLQGTIEATTKIIAEAKFNALGTAYQTSGFKRRKVNFKESIIDGGDLQLSTPEHTQYDFSIDFDQWIYTIWKLDISTDTSPSGNKITYSGSVTSPSSTAALTKAREIGNDLSTPHPVQVNSKESIKTVADPISLTTGETPNDPDNNDTEFIEITFAYTYAVASTEIKASITQTISTPAFADYTTSISGEITATSEAAAIAAAKTYIPNNKNPSTSSETSTTLRDASNTQWTTLSFNYGWRNAHTLTSLKYTDSFTPNYTSMTGLRTYAGTARANTKILATAAIDGIITDPLPNDGKLTGYQISEPVESFNGIQEFIQIDFNISIEEDLTGTPAHDLIEAQYSLERLGQVPLSPIHVTTHGDPILQSFPNSLNIGQLTISGSCKARLEATARNWGQSHRTTVNSFGSGDAAELPPRERTQPNFKAFNGSEPKTYTFNFTYSAKYASGLEGTWPTSGLNLTPTP